MQVLCEWEQAGLTASILTVTPNSSFIDKRRRIVF